MEYFKEIAIPINATTKKARFRCDYGPGPKKSYHETVQEARKHCLDILKDHPGYTVRINKIEEKKEVPLGGYYDMKFKEISCLHF